MKSTIFCLVSILFILSACEKPDISPGTKNEYSNTPEILSVELDQDTVLVGEDLEFTITYRDGDGDIGFSSGDSLSMFIIDPRFPLEVGYFIPVMAPENSLPLVIQGTFIANLEGIILQDNSIMEETVNFEISLIDRSGNQSEIFTCPSTLIKK